MKIAMISEHASPLARPGSVDSGGQNVHVAELSTALARRGHELVVYTRRDSEELPDRVRLAPGVEVEHVPAGPARPIAKDELLPYMAAFGHQLARRWQLARPDVVHAHFWMSGVAALTGIAGMGNSGLPLVQTFHALGSVKRRWQAAADTSPAERIGIERRLVRSADRIIATCSDERLELLALGAPAAAIEVVPCGVDLARFQPAPEAVVPGRILCVGRLVPRKGVDDVIRALARLPRAELVVAGGPPAAELAGDAEAGRLMALAAECGVADRVRLLGQVGHAELPELIRSAAVVVSVPWYEPFGIVPLEAMACGVPVVASAVGGMLDTVLPERTGLLVPPRQPAALAGAVDRVLADTSLRRRLGQGAVARARAEYGWPAVAERTERCLHAILRSRSRAEVLEAGR